MAVVFLGNVSVHLTPAQLSKCSYLQSFVDRRKQMREELRVLREYGMPEVLHDIILDYDTSFDLLLCGKLENRIKLESVLSANSGVSQLALEGLRDFLQGCVDHGLPAMPSIPLHNQRHTFEPWVHTLFESWWQTSTIPQNSTVTQRAASMTGLWNAIMILSYNIEFTLLTHLMGVRVATIVVVGNVGI